MVDICRRYHAKQAAEKLLRYTRTSMVRTWGTTRNTSVRMLKKVVQQGRSERRAEAYPLGYVEDLSDARTMLAELFSILLLDRG